MRQDDNIAQLRRIGTLHCLEVLSIANIVASCARSPRRRRPASRRRPYVARFAGVMGPARRGSRIGRQIVEGLNFRHNPTSR